MSLTNVDLVSLQPEAPQIQGAFLRAPVKHPANGRIMEFRVKPVAQIQRNFVPCVIEV
jgi:hypothetical protein